jgi:F-type H+/Na+-transporting ATPase subunit alpha
LSVAQMAVSLFAANEGYLDSIEVNKVLSFEASLHAYMKNEQSELMDKINKTGDFSDEIRDGMKKAIDKFIKTSSW